MFDLQPDAKSQITVKYVDGKPVGCTKVVVSTQHNEKSRNGKKYSPGLIKDMIAPRSRVGAAEGLDAGKDHLTSWSIRPAISWSAVPTAIAA